MTKGKRPALTVGLNPETARRLRDDLRGRKVSRAQMKAAVEAEIVEVEREIFERRLQVWRMRVWLGRCK